MSESVIISTEQNDPMAPGEANKQFLAALRHLIKEQRKTQIEIAEVAGCSKNHLNAAINERGKTTLGAQRQEAIARYFGYSMSEFLGLGKRIIENVPGPTPQPPQQFPVDQSPLPPAAIPSDFVSADHLADTLSLISRSFRKADDRRKFWRSVIEQLPTPAVIIRDWTVVYQNKASRDIRLIERSEICLGCDNIGHCDKEDCPIHKAMRTRTHEVAYKVSGTHGMLCRIDVTPLNFDEHDHFLLTCTSIADYGEKAEELERLQREQQFVGACEFSPPAAYIDRKSSRVGYLNQSLRNFLGIGADEVLSQETLMVLLHKKLASGRAVADAIDAALDSGEPGLVKGRIVASSDIYHFILRPHYFDGEVVGTLLIIIDKDEHSFYKSRGLV